MDDGAGRDDDGNNSGNDDDDDEMASHADEMTSLWCRCWC